MLVLADSKPGHANQALGVAEALGWPFETKHLSYTSKAAWPNVLRYGSLRGIDLHQSDPITPPWPDVVIAAGRRTAPVAQYIKRKSKGKTFTAQLMWPGFPSCGLDLLAVPIHDHIAPSKRIMTTLGAPHRMQPSLMENEARIWKRTIGELPGPYIAVLVGGDTDTTQFNLYEANKLIRYVTALAEQAGASLLISTSRRTPSVSLPAFRQLDYPHYLYEWKAHGANPYYAFVSMASAVVVTGDSVSMCSEACGSGKPVYIYDSEAIVPKKSKEFVCSLIEQHYAYRLDRDTSQAVSQAHKLVTLNEADRIAKVIKKRLISS